jgi:amino acid transporter
MAAVIPLSTSGEARMQVLHKTGRVALVPRIGFWGATSANVLNMIGVGPFLTIPLALGAMGGPQAMLGWILGAFISLCDGMVWAELGSAMPFSGGPYYYLLHAFGPRGLGQLFSFLFLWQSIILGPLSIAGGAVGFAQYTAYLFPLLHHWGTVAVAAMVCLVNMGLVYRNIRSIAHLSIAIAVIVIASTVWIIFSGVTHFHSGLALDFPPHAFHLSRGFFFGLGSATLFAVYDYGGYYNVCLIGDEVKHPKTTLPRSILFSILLVAAIYLVMNVAIIGVVPWREAIHSQAIVADFMVRIDGALGGKVVAVLIVIASFGSVFAVLLGYSRIPYAAAIEGQFFSVFARLHPRGNFPYVSILALGVCSAAACLFSLESLFTALIVAQTVLQFAGQCVAVMLLRARKKERADSYRMPLFPLPALIALLGWIYIVVTSGLRYIAFAAGLLALGVAMYLLRARRRADWPFAESAA